MYIHIYIYIYIHRVYILRGTKGDPRKGAGASVDVRG